MHSSSPMTAPKSQLAAEQPLTGHWSPPETDTPRPKAKKQPPRDSRKSTITIKSDPTPARWVTHKLDIKTIIPKKLSPTVVKVLTPTSGFPACGSNKGTGNPQEIWP